MTPDEARARFDSVRDRNDAIWRMRDLRFSKASHIAHDSPEYLEAIQMAAGTLVEMEYSTSDYNEALSDVVSLSVDLESLIRSEALAIQIASLYSSTSVNDLMWELARRIERYHVTAAKPVWPPASSSPAPDSP